MLFRSGAVVSIRTPEGLSPESRARWLVPAGGAGVWFGMVLGSAYCLAALLTYRSDGIARPPDFGLLFASNSRFTDTYTLLGLLHAGGMYQAGFQYPPGSLFVIHLIDRYFLADIGLPQCVAASGAMGAVIGVLAFRDADIGERIAAGLAAAACTYLAVTTDGRYVVTIFVAGGATVLVILACWALRIPVPRITLVPAISVCYPLVFSVDRGNLETYVFALLALSACFVFGVRRSAGEIGRAHV